VKTGALLVSMARGSPRYAFNVGSIGLDAFIVGLTNRFKRVLPGAYKALVDVGSLFYEQRVKQMPMDVRIFSKTGQVDIKGIVPSMVIVGVSGGRSYGGQMPVLPGVDNVCVIDHMGFMDKIRNKSLFYVGRHGELPQVRFYSADRVDMEYHGKIPMQLDGELMWLDEKDFPVSMRVLPPMINVLKA
jgi:diacylglycerol kinase family enzyme